MVALQQGVVFPHGHLSEPGMQWKNTTGWCGALSICLGHPSFATLMRILLVDGQTCRGALGCAMEDGREILHHAIHSSGVHLWLPLAVLHIQESGQNLMDGVFFERCKAHGSQAFGHHRHHIIFGDGTFQSGPILLGEVGWNTNNSLATAG